MLKICRAQSMKHTNNNQTSKKDNEQSKNTHKHSIKQKINQANNQSSTPSIKSNNQRKKTIKLEEETLYKKLCNSRSTAPGGCYVKNSSTQKPRDNCKNNGKNVRTTEK